MVKIGSFFRPQKKVHIRFLTPFWHLFSFCSFLENSGLNRSGTDEGRHKRSQEPQKRVKMAISALLEGSQIGILGYLLGYPRVQKWVKMGSKWGQNGVNWVIFDQNGTFLSIFGPFPFKCLMAIFEFFVLFHDFTIYVIFEPRNY